jgi:hypothetical protein
VNWYEDWRAVLNEEVANRRAGVHQLRAPFGACIRACVQCKNDHWATPKAGHTIFAAVTNPRKGWRARYFVAPRNIHMKTK